MPPRASCPSPAFTPEHRLADAGMGPTLALVLCRQELKAAQNQSARSTAGIMMELRWPSIPSSLAMAACPPSAPASEDVGRGLNLTEPSTY